MPRRGAFLGVFGASITGDELVVADAAIASSRATIVAAATHATHALVCSVTMTRIV